MVQAVVIDMGLGNIRSLVSALEYLGVQPKVDHTVDSLEQASHLILPGVGAFDAAMSRLNDLGLVDPIRDQVLEQGKPILGICLGMQLLCSGSEEGELPGLDLVAGRFDRLQPDLAAGHKVPHVGFA